MLFFWKWRLKFAFHFTSICFSIALINRFRVSINCDVPVHCEWWVSCEVLGKSFDIHHWFALTISLGCTLFYYVSNGLYRPHAHMWDAISDLLHSNMNIIIEVQVFLKSISIILSIRHGHLKRKLPKNLIENLKNQLTFISFLNTKYFIKHWTMGNS